MKLSTRDIPGVVRNPDPNRPGILFYGADAMRIATKRQEFVAAFVGPEAEAEMRLTRLQAADVRSDPAQVQDGLKATGFFLGPRALVIEDATDGLSKLISDALDAWEPGDAALVITAGQLTPRSALRKLFEGHGSAYAAPIYDEPMSREEIEQALSQAGLGEVAREAMAELERLSRVLEPGDFRQTVEKVGLYKLNDPSALTIADIDAVAPESTEAALDDVVDVVSEARVDEIGPLLRRIEAQGITPVTLTIAATRHFRTLYSAASDPDGAAKGASKLRPPLHFRRRDRVIRQANSWGARKLEDAMRLLTDTDLTLRSASTAPQMALVERAFVRLAMMARR